MIKKFLKAAGVKTKEEFYKKYPSEAAFFKAHPEMKKMKKGGELKKLNQLTSYSGDVDNIMPKAQGGTQIDPTDYFAASCGPTQVYDSTLGMCVEKPLDEGQGYNMGQIAKSEPRSEYAKEETAKAKYEADPIQTGQDKMKGSGLIDKLGGAEGIGVLAGNVISGIQEIGEQKKRLKEAQKMERLSSLTEQAVASGMGKDMYRRRRVSPEDEAFTISEKGLDPQGRNINYLSAEDGAIINQIGGNPTEIQNMYNPGDLYSNLGYEPLDDSNTIKRFEWGGMPKAQDGFDWGEFASSGGTNAATSLGRMVGGDSAWGNLGGTVLGGIGSIVGGPVGGLIGKFVGQALGALDPTAKKIKSTREKAMQSMGRAGFMSGVQSLNDTYGAVKEDGGYVSHNWNPQVITKWGDIDVSDVHNIFMEGMPRYRTGGNLRQNYMSYDEEQLRNMDFGGQLQVLDGGYAEPIGYNPYLPNTGQVLMLRGRSHDDGGMPMKYGENMVEAEGGEPVVELPDAEGGSKMGKDVSANIAGNLKISKEVADFVGDNKVSGQKYKNVVRDIAKEDAKINDKRNKNMEKLSDIEPLTPFDKLKLNSLTMNNLGYNMKQAKNAKKIEDLMMRQNMINDTKDAMSAALGREVSADSLAMGKFAFEKNPSGEYAQAGKKIKSSEKSAYLAKGWKQDPKNPNRLYKEGKEIVIPGKKETKTTGERKAAPKAIPGGTAGEPWRRRMTQLLNSGVTYEDLAAAGHGTVSGLKKMFPNEYRPAQTTTETVTPDTVRRESIEEVFVQGEPAKKKDGLIQVEKSKATPWISALSQLIPYLRPSDVEGGLRPYQLYPEQMALSLNQLEAVPAQLPTPLLKQPYRISLEDMRNQVRSTYNTAMRSVRNNPSALAALAADESQQLNRIGSEEFRMNQAEYAGTYDENRKRLMENQMQKLQILDNQYVRQSQARSKTKDVALAAIQSMSGKIGQQALEDATLAVYENLYNFRYGPGYRAQNFNPLAQFNISQVGKALVPVYDANGNIRGYTMPDEPTTTVEVEDETTTTTPTPTYSSASIPTLLDPNAPGYQPQPIGQSWMPQQKNGGKQKKLNSTIVKAFKNL